MSEESRLAQAILRYRDALLKAERESAVRLVNAYGAVYERLQDKIRALEADIAALGESPSRAQVLKLQRYHELLAQTAEELNKYSTVLENEVGVMRVRAIQEALAKSKSLVQLALPDLPAAAKAALLGNFNNLPDAAIQSLLGSLSKNSPLADLLNTFGADAAEQVGSAILQGVALGYNPAKVAAQIRNALGGDLTRALTISRTEMLRAYRTASLASYAANSDTVKGWRWLATKDARNPPCLACLALDGQEFGNDQLFMENHPNCRCAPEPVTVSYQDLGLNAPNTSQARQTGAEWFGGLSESEQRAAFPSAAAWSAYQDGAVTLRDFIGKTESADWGAAYVERSLKDILGADAERYYN